MQTNKTKKHKRPMSGRRTLNGIAGSDSGSDATYDSNYGYSAGRCTISRDPSKNLRKGDLTPYATAHLADHYNPEELTAFDLRHSMVGHGNTLPGMTVPFYPQGQSRMQPGFENGVFPSTVDVVNFQGHIQQMPQMPETFLTGNPAFFPTGSKTPLPGTPNRILDAKSTNLSLPPPTPTVGDDNNICETTFNFPPPPDVTVANGGRHGSIGKYDEPWDVKKNKNSK